MLRALKYIGTFIGISFTTLLISALTLSQNTGPLLWLGISLAAAILMTKHWNRNGPKPARSKPPTQPTPKEPTPQPEPEKFIPWTEQDLLWSGKRKLTIEYTDADGNFTERPIVIHGIWPSQTGEIHFRAFCELRDDWRTFHADRVEQVTDARRRKYPDFHAYMKDGLEI